MVPCLVECVRGMISFPRASAPRSGPVTDALCPESKPTLDEIAKLLREKSDLRLDIIGHTDNRGTPDYNMNLSRCCAAIVVAALIRDYEIAADWLGSSGAGLTSPVATNDTDEVAG
jgi:OOP family OmpA-OmpF porin